MRRTDASGAGAGRRPRPQSMLLLHAEAAYDTDEDTNTGDDLEHDASSVSTTLDVDPEDDAAFLAARRRSRRYTDQAKRFAIIEDHTRTLLSESPEDGVRESSTDSPPVTAVENLFVRAKSVKLPNSNNSENNSSSSIAATNDGNINSAAAGALSPAEQAAKERERAERHAVKLHKAIEELLATEETYVSSLDAVTQGYVEQIPENILSDEEKLVVFCNVPELLDFHRQLHRAMRQAGDDVTQIAKTFVDLSEDFLELYSQYCIRHDRSLTFLKLRQNDEKLTTVLKSCQMALGHRLPLASFLLQPVQRLLRYGLLLREICQHLPESSPHMAPLREAMDNMQKISAAVNRLKRSQELKSIVQGEVIVTRSQGLQHRLAAGGFEGDVEQYGALLDEAGDIDVLTEKLKPKGSKKHLYLFEKCLLICRIRQDTTITVKDMFHLKPGLKVELMDPRTMTVADAEEKQIFRSARLDAGAWVTRLKELCNEADESATLKLNSSRLSASSAGGAFGGGNSAATGRSGSGSAPRGMFGRRQATSTVSRSSVESESGLSPTKNDLGHQSHLDSVLSSVSSPTSAAAAAADLRKQQELDRQMRAAAEQKASEAEKERQAAEAKLAQEREQLSKERQRLEQLEKQLAVKQAEDEMTAALLHKKDILSSLVWQPQSISLEELQRADLEGYVSTVMRAPLPSTFVSMDRLTCRGELSVLHTSWLDSLLDRLWVARWYVLSVSSGRLVAYSNQSELHVRNSVNLTDICAVKQPSDCVVQVVLPHRAIFLQAPEAKAATVWATALRIFVPAV
eukprot:m.41666 g.41666  ORF g.41666 m.41666 type:complete len:798 (+) comp12033_c0_seq1:399-2792(+)